MGAAGSGDVSYSINQSIRFNKNDSPRMTQTFDTPSDANKWTLSVWSKLGRTGNGMRFLEAGGSAGSEDFIGFAGSSGYEKLYFWKRTSSSYNYNLTSTQLFRDPSAWYHFVYVFDSSNTLTTERMKAYVNGQKITDFSTETYPSSGLASRINTAVEHRIGNPVYSSSNHADGYIAEMHFLDGYAYGPEFFGEFKEDTDIWTPIRYTGSYGTNGFYLKGQNESALGDDSSGNNNDFTTSGLASHDQVSDSPTNNFNVMNPLANYYAGHTYKNGNLEVLTSTTTNQYTYSVSSIGMSSGKWYAEAYIDESNAGQILIGISDREAQGGTHYLGSQSYEFSYYSYNGNKYEGGSASSYGNTFTTDDIIGIALDLDNSKLYFSKNGTFQNSGVPTSGSTGTGALSITAVGSTQNRVYHFAVGDYSNAGNITVYWNFGQEGTFAGNTTAGGNSDSNGVGNFKYSVPSGYLALCTKNLGS